MSGDKPKVIAVFGSKGSSKGQFQAIWDIKINANNGNIYISDLTRVQIFNHECTYQRDLAVMGKSPGQLSQPAGVALDLGSREIFVVEEKLCRVSVFTLDSATFVRSFGSQGWHEAQFNEPCGVCCDSRGLVFIAGLDVCFASVML